MSFNLEILKGQENFDRCIALLNTYLEVKTADLVLIVTKLATMAAVEVFSDIPILFCSVLDTVGSGIVKAIDKPSGSNVNGIVLTRQQDTKVEMVY